MIEITELDSFSVEDLAEINALIPQLSGSASPLLESDLSEIVHSGATRFFVARLEGKLVGTLTLAVFRIPTGVRAWIEDVVVDGAARGFGVGEALVSRALQAARDNGALTVDLTSRPEREAANRLYLKCGFETRNTNVFRFRL